MGRWTILLVLVGLGLGCQSRHPYDALDPAIGPGGLVGNGLPVSDGNFTGGHDVLPSARGVAAPDPSRPPDCDGTCVAYCDMANLTNPVNRGMCRSLWGVGLAHQPVNAVQACRRLFVDLIGRLPTADDIAQTCQGDYGATVKALMARDEFIFINQRRMADKFLYSSEVVSVERIYDMDRLVAKLMKGLVAYDQFAAVASAHPVLVRRSVDPGDRVEMLFRLFLGRPPFENERADLGRLYALWHSGYYDHPYLNVRLPDAFLRYRCLTEDNKEIDPDTRGLCTSVLWGYHELIFKPDFRAAVDRSINDNPLTMWSGLIRAEEWAELQVPGKILAQQTAFWERAVDDVLEQYLGYSLSALVPEVRQELVKYLLSFNGDIRAVHYAVVTSAAYLQSHEGSTVTPYRWSYGPIKQLDAEVWLDAILGQGTQTLPTCDFRISNPELLLEGGSFSAYRLINGSKWKFGSDGELDTRYSEMARTLGGCPENVVGGRFRVVSILTTATQLNVVDALCNPTHREDVDQAPVDRLLPSGVSASAPLTVSLSRDIATHQYRMLLSRDPLLDEQTAVQDAAEQCALTQCNAEDFARPLCFALLSSAERLFY
jgi:hypothetical protein